MATGALITSAIAQAVNVGVTYHQGEQQIKQQKKQMAFDQYTAQKQQEAANEEAIAQKQALVAEQESMASQAESYDKKKSKSSYQKQASAWSSTGLGFGLGAKENGKLG